MTGLDSVLDYNYQFIKPIIISLFDYTGTWSLPYRQKGYRVIQIDIKLGIDIYDWYYKNIPIDKVRGILIAPPCTHFASSGAQYWPKKDKEGITKDSIELVEYSLDIVEYFNPKFWVLENPVGRLPKLIPSIGKPKYFHPYEFGDSWKKKTGLWGKFKFPNYNKVEPIIYSKQGSWMQLLGGKSERTKELRSITPPMFSKAFCEANP